MNGIREPILITGAAGFIGSNLLRRLIKKKIKVKYFGFEKKCYYNDEY